MTRLFLATSGVLVCLVCAASTGSAATYYVSNSGNDGWPGTSGQPFATIQRAATAAVQGDTIIVRSGTYAGARFSTSGTAALPITLRGEPGAVVVSPGPQNSNGDNIWIRNASYVTVENLEIRNASRAGIAVQAEPDAESHGVIIRNCYCHDNNRWGVFTAYAEGILITGNECSYSGIEHGIYVSNSSDNPVIEFNIVHHNNASGIQINADPALPGDGIISNARVDSNTCYENGAAGGAAINLASVINSRITNNLLYDNHASGIAGWDDGNGSQWGTHNNEILCNTIVQASNGRFALSLLNGSSSNTILNNILIHPGSRGSIDIDSASETGINSNRNIIVDRFSVDDVFITAASWQSRGPGHDNQSIISNSTAVFVSAALDNYRLKPGGPAIDSAGVPPGVTLDLERDVRPQGLGHDMGALEYRGADSVGVYSAASGTWFLRNTNSNGVADLTFFYGPGGAGWIPLRGDWNGDGVDTAGVYDPANGVFHLRNSNSNGAADATFFYGPANQGWLPVAGDWNDDGIDTIGLYNPVTSVFYLRNSNSSGIADITFPYGPPAAGWLPLAGDWNGDGSDTVGLYQPSAGAFYLRNSNDAGAADLSFFYGPVNATPLVGDWDGDVVDTVGVYTAANGAWFLRLTNTPGPADIALFYGPAGQTPIVGDWNGQ
jgi:hypothetical protein